MLCQRIAAGRPVAHVAAEMGISRTCAYRWWARYRQHGPAGLAGPAQPRPPASPPRACRAGGSGLALRRARKLGPARIGPLVGRAPSTVYRVLCRHQLNRLTSRYRPSGRRIRRYEWDQPGELVHMDVKKLGRLRDGGGHRVHGRDSTQHRSAPRHRGHRIGYDYIHAVVDDHSRLAYAEVLADERGDSCAEFLRRAGGFFAVHGIPSSGC